MEGRGMEGCGRERGTETQMLDKLRLQVNNHTVRGGI